MVFSVIFGMIGFFLILVGFEVGCVMEVGFVLVLVREFFYEWVVMFLVIIISYV